LIFFLLNKNKKILIKPFKNENLKNLKKILKKHQKKKEKVLGAPFIKGAPKFLSKN
jgi:hypothetical protein